MFRQKLTSFLNLLRLSRTFGAVSREHSVAGIAVALTSGGPSVTYVTPAFVSSQGRRAPPARKIKTASVPRFIHVAYHRAEHLSRPPQSGSGSRQSRQKVRTPSGRAALSLTFARPPVRVVGQFLLFKRCGSFSGRAACSLKAAPGSAFGVQSASPQIVNSDAAVTKPQSLQTATLCAAGYGGRERALLPGSGNQRMRKAARGDGSGVVGYACGLQSSGRAAAGAKVPHSCAPLRPPSLLLTH